MMRRVHLLGLVLFTGLAWSSLPAGAFAAEGGVAEAGAASPEQASAEQASAEQAAAEEKELFELLTLFADTVDQIERNYVKKVSRRELMESAIKGMIDKLDQYSDYIPPEDLERFRSGVDNEFGGIGIQVSIDSGKLTIVSPLVDTPAYRAGLVAGDHITKIEGESTEGLSLDEVVKRLKGKEGTSVTLTVYHPHDESTETLTLKREVVRVQTVMGDQRNSDDSWDFMLDDSNKIGYVRVSAFGRHTTQELKTALEKLKAEGMKALVLDLRFNPGGLLSTAIEVCDLFISKGRIVSTAGRNAPERVWEAKSTGTFEGFPMVVLVNRYSASASEIVSACLQDHDRAVVVGERSWGKGSVQNIVELEGGRSALKLTTAGYLRPNGHNIHRFEGAKEEDEWGVSPNDGFLIRLTDADVGRLVRTRRERDILNKEPRPPAPEFADEQLNRSLEHLRDLLGKNVRAEAPAPKLEKD